MEPKGSKVVALQVRIHHASTLPIRIYPFLRKITIIAKCSLRLTAIIKKSRYPDGRVLCEHFSSGLSTWYWHFILKTFYRAGAVCWLVGAGACR